MLRGRKPISAEERKLAGKKLSGSPPANPHPAKNKNPLGAAPKWMTKAQKQIWDEGLKSAPAGILRQIDSSVYESWVLAAASRRSASAQYEDEGERAIVTTVNGNTKPNPLLTIIRQESMMMLRCASEMGFTPTARMRVKGDGDDKGKGNPFDEFAGQAPGSNAEGFRSVN